MEQYKTGNATIRISGKCDPKKLHTATINFIKKAELQKKRGKRNAQ